MPLLGGAAMPEFQTAHKRPVEVPWEGCLLLACHGFIVLSPL